MKRILCLVAFMAAHCCATHCDDPQSQSLSPPDRISAKVEDQWQGSFSADNTSTQDGQGAAAQHTVIGRDSNQLPDKDSSSGTSLTQLDREATIKVESSIPGKGETQTIRRETSQGTDMLKAEGRGTEGERGLRSVEPKALEEMEERNKKQNRIESVSKNGKVVRDTQYAERGNGDFNVKNDRKADEILHHSRSQRYRRADAAPAGTCSSVYGDMTNDLPIDNHVTVSYRWDNVGLTVRAVLDRNIGNGWFAFGFAGQPNHMTPADTVIGYGSGAIGELTLNSATDAGVVAKNSPSRIGAAQIVLQPASNNWPQGTTTLEFEYPLADIRADQNGVVNLIYAYGLGALTYHGPNQRGDRSAAYNSCQPINAARGTDKKLLAHGILMFIGWGVLCPTAIMVARFGKQFSKKSKVPKAWFYVHVSLQVTTVLLSTAGLVMAVLMVDEFDAGIHQVLGIIVIALGYIQPLSSLIRPHLPVPGGVKSRPRRLWEAWHKMVGRCCALMVLVNIGFGLSAAAAQWSLFITYYIWLGVLGAIFAILTLGTAYLPIGSGKGLTAHPMTSLPSSRRGEETLLSH